MGRPTRYGKKLATVICERLMEGESLRRICQDEAMPGRTTIFRWLQDNEEFRDQYARAREFQAEVLLDDMLDIADDGTNDFVEKQVAVGRVVTVFDKEAVLRSKLRVDTRKVIMEKLAPKKYGAKSQLEHSGPDGGPIETKSVGLSGLLDEARSASES